MRKNKKFGWTVWTLYLRPAIDNSFKVDVCPGRSKGCTKLCLAYNGHSGMKRTRDIQRHKTDFYIKHPDLFESMLEIEIMKIKLMDGSHAVRLNGTSDIDWLDLARRHPEVQFYDYTKVRERLEVAPKNYDLTYSYSGENKLQCIDALHSGHRVSVVFQDLSASSEKKQRLPDEWWGYPVIDGDENDLRFTQPKGVIVGLKAKGSKGKKWRTDNPFFVRI